MEGSCEHGNELSSSIKCWEIFEYLHTWRLLKKCSAPYSYRVKPGNVFIGTGLGSLRMYFQVPSTSVGLHIGTKMASQNVFNFSSYQFLVLRPLLRKFKFFFLLIIQGSKSLACPPPHPLSAHVDPTYAREFSRSKLVPFQYPPLMGITADRFNLI
jgi:hypothetical protein